MKNIKAKSVALSTTAVITLLSSTCSVKAEEAQPTVSPESTSQSETAAPAEKLKAPEAVSDKTGSHSLTIQTKAGWQYSISTEEDLLGTDWTDQTKEDGEYTFDHLNENTVYYIQGRTTDDAGNVTAVSEVLSVSTKPAEKEEKQDSAESTDSPASETAEPEASETPSSDEAASTESAEAQATEAPVQVNKMMAKVMAVTVKAGEKYQNGHWYFVKSDGTNATGITNIGYKTVYYNKNGEMQFGVFRGDDGKLYLSDAIDGTLVQKQGEKYVNGHWYYVKADGTLATGVTNIGYKTVYYNQNGEMQFGYYRDSNGKLCHSDPVDGTLSQNGFEYYNNGHWYYVKADGSYATGVTNIGYKTVYYNQNGEMQFGYYRDSNGKLCHSDPVDGTLSQNGFEYYNNGHWYYVKADGSYATGVTNIGYKTVYYNEKGEMQFGYYRDSNGKLCHSDPVNGTLSQNGFEYYNNGHWYFVKPDGSFATGLTNIGYKTVYYSEKGEMHFGEKNIGGYWYFFDLADGSMRTGFVTLPDGRKVYYDGAGHMVFGKQLINGSYYYFDTVDGHMYSNRVINGEYYRRDGRLMNNFESIAPVPFINQYANGAPTGCEGAAALQALKGLGYCQNMSLHQFLDGMPYSWDGNPNHGFVGSPYTESWGRYASINPGPLTPYVNRFAPARNISGATTDMLLAELREGHPVIVWGSERWAPTTILHYSWGIGLATNHCMTLYGYNSNGDLHIMDPIYGDTWVSRYAFDNIYNIRHYAIAVG